MINFLRSFLSLRFNLPAGMMITAALMILSAAVVFLYVQQNLEYAVTVLPLNQAESGFVYGAWPELASANFFEGVKQGFLDEKVPFVEADLSAMTLRVYREEGLALEVPIKSKGREGSWWETPSGLYKAEGKERNHFSSFGHVFMPYSIPFQGNFFIHGWPYYPGGVEVPESFSGGCIRLATEDAARVFDLIDRGMPILVFEGDFIADEFSYALSPPKVMAESYLAVDVRNNFVFLGANQTERRATAVLPKLMTALVASEYQNVEKNIPIVEGMFANPDDSSAQRIEPTRLSIGETYTVYDLLFPLLLESSAEAARALTYYLGSARAVSLMQQKARSLGMEHTEFTDPAGLKEGNLTTAEDLVLFARYLYNNRPFILRMSAGNSEKNVYGEPAFSDIKPAHPAAEDEEFLGGLADAQEIDETSAVGLDSVPEEPSDTDAQNNIEDNIEELHDVKTEDLFVLLEIGFRDEKRPVAIILLDSPDPAGDLEAVRHYIETTYR